MIAFEGRIRDDLQRLEGAIESRKKPPDERLRKWVDSQNEATQYLGVLTLGEL